jgi:competence protein ComEC
LRTPLRWSGAGSIALAVVWALAVPQPDILISGDGHTVGVRGRDGRLHLMRTAKDTFLVKEWLAADADARLPGEVSLGDGVSCDEAGCVAQLPDGAFAALVLRPEALSDDCTRAAVIVTSRQASPGCKSLVISQERLQKQSAITLRRTRGGFVIDAVRPNGLNRPWLPASGEPTETENSAVRPAVARPADATPAEADLQAED